MSVNKDLVAGFYDKFSGHQEKVGVNSRHLMILDKLIEAGLQPHHQVLEIGCGIGAVSQLIAKKTKKGKILAVDISPKSIERARLLWKDIKNLNFEVSDMEEFYQKDTFYDFVVLPDVLEHIPVENHPSLFQTIKRHSHAHTTIFVHIPSPRFLEWMIRNEPKKLQVIDQALDSGELVKNASVSGFHLDKMETYSLFYLEKDYQYFVFRSDKPLEKVTHKNKWRVLKERITIKIRNGIFI
ncbi:MAG: class I SAM-dependent methyltransferase [Cyclobacteriaceae bacterium]